MALRRRQITSHPRASGSRTAFRIFAVALVAAVGAVFAHARTHETPVTYHAVARVELPHLPTGRAQAASLARRLAVAVRRAHVDPPARVQVIGTPGSRGVQVSAVAPRHDATLAAANRTAAELLADDRGVDRVMLARRIAAIERELRTASGAAADRLRKTLRTARARQVGNDDFLPAPAAVRATGPRPVQDPLAAAGIGALAAAAALAAASRLTGRAAIA